MTTADQKTYNRVYAAQRIAGYAKAGVCTRCGNERDGEYLMCSHCRETRAANKRRSRANANVH